MSVETLGVSGLDIEGSVVSGSIVKAQTRSEGNTFTRQSIEVVLEMSRSDGVVSLGDR
jgi:hypothetical protein